MSRRKKKNDKSVAVDAFVPLFQRRPLSELRRGNRPFVIDEPVKTAGLKVAAPARGRRPVEADLALAEAAYRASTTPQLRRRIRNARATCIVVSVPGPSWVGPVTALLGTILEDASVYARDGSDRKHAAGLGNDAVARALFEGKVVLGISHDPARLLPDVLVTGADISVTIARTDRNAIAAAMRRCLTGPLPGRLPRDLGAGLDLEQIASALRKGSKPAEAVARLQEMARKKTAARSEAKLPRLEDCAFYGEAQRWGLALARDLDDARLGLTGFDACDRGCVLFGEPGTGKSVAARVIAAACGLPVIELSMAELFAAGTGYLDSMIKNMRAAFAKAASARPSAILLDECDQIPNRLTLDSRNRDYWLPLCNDLLAQISQLPAGCIAIACTNVRIEMLDPALLRPGRLERAFEIKAPSTPEELAGVMRFHLGEDLKDADLHQLARLGAGATPARVMDWTRSARRSARAQARPMSVTDLFAAIIPTDSRPAALLKTNAVHEAGHAMVNLALAHDKIGFLSLVQDGISNGRMRIEDPTDMSLAGRERLEQWITVLLGGRAAEIVCIGHCTVGGGGAAASDLGRATRVCAAIHSSFGLGETLTFRGAYEKAADALEFDATLRAIVEKELQRLQAIAIDIVRANRRGVEAIARVLLEKRFLEGSEVEALFAAAHDATMAEERLREGGGNGR